MSLFRPQTRVDANPVIWTVVIVAALVRWVFRFISGRPMNGKRKTDATFFRSGSVKFTDSDRAGRWSYLPEWKRAAIRVGTAAVLLGLSVGYVVAPFATFIAMCVLIIGGATFVGYRVYRVIQRMRVNRTVIRPLYRALEPRGIQRIEWICIPSDYATNEKAEVTVRLPDTFLGDAEQRKLIYGVVQRKIGGEWDPHWTDVGRPSLRLTHAPVPPGKVLFADVLDTIRRLEEGRVLLGLGSRGESVIIDFNAETPHVALSIGTGGGKSATLCLLIVQLLAQGATIQGIDPKRVSLNAVRDLPGLTIHRDVEQQWDAVSMVRAEMERRYLEIDRDETVTFSRLVLVIEEANTFAIDSAEYWEEVKPKGAPKTPRVYKDLNAILNKGRQANVNVITVFQRADAAVSGGGAARDQYGMKVLGRFSPQAWKMLVDTYPRPKSSKHRGRVIVSDGSDHRTVQTVYALDGVQLAQTARDYALTGRSGLSVPGRRTGPPLVTQAGSETVGTTETVIPEQRPIGLARAVELGVLHLSLDAVRKARLRDPEFPAPADNSGQEHLYHPDELTQWEKNRPRANSARSA